MTDRVDNAQELRTISEEGQAQRDCCETFKYVLRWLKDDAVHEKIFTSTFRGRQAIMDQMGIDDDTPFAFKKDGVACGPEQWKWLLKAPLGALVTAPTR